jgi:hypothetical protein
LNQLESLEDEMLTDGQHSNQNPVAAASHSAIFRSVRILNGLASVSAILGEQSKEGGGFGVTETARRVGSIRNEGCLGF